MSRRPPGFFLIGAPKVGTSALHAALAVHPHLFLSPVKEPKYYMCGDSVFDFPGVEGADIADIPSDNSRVFVRDGVRARTVGR